MIIYHKKIIIRPPPPSSWTAKGQVGLLLGFTEFFSAAPDFYSILFCFTAFYWTCFGIYWDLLGFTGFYWVSCFFLFYIREIRVCQRNPPPSPPKKSAGERRRSANAAANGKKEAPPTAYLRPTPRPRLVSRTGGLRPSNAPKKKTTHRPLNKSSNRAGTPPSSFTFFCCLFLLKPKFLHDRPRVPISLPSVFSTFNPRFSINYHLLFFLSMKPEFLHDRPRVAISLPSVFSTFNNCFPINYRSKKKHPHLMIVAIATRERRNRKKKRHQQLRARQRCPFRDSRWSSDCEGC